MKARGGLPPIAAPGWLAFKKGPDRSGPQGASSFVADYWYVPVSVAPE